MGDQLTTLRWEALSAHPALPMGPSVHRPSARLYGSWVWGVTCVKELRLQSQRSSLNLELNLRQLSLRAPTACTDRGHPIAPRRCEAQVGGSAIFSGFCGLYIYTFNRGSTA